MAINIGGMKAVINASWNTWGRQTNAVLDKLAAEALTPDDVPQLVDAATADNIANGPLTTAQLGSAYVAFGATDPASFLPSGTEYVWNKTDGAGTLLDIVSGVA